MKIAVCGSGFAGQSSISETAKGIGREIARSGHVLLTGGCRGYPYAALRGAILCKGESVCYSPAGSRDEHVNQYGFPLEESADYIFTGMGVPGRNLALIKGSEGVIILDGGIGTLNEFTIALALGKKIAVLDIPGKFLELLHGIERLCSISKKIADIRYCSGARELVKGVEH
ncbi:LOG family protein [Candidatus Woesearchaeota archaeon]|nr:LOG family protein [Candidatus Woesearchaeota archaeon]